MSLAPSTPPAADSQPEHPSQYRLLRENRFAPFFWTQFLGAMNDNVFKIGFTSLLTYQAVLFGGIDSKSAAFLISAIFIVPFVLFSATSGQISDKFDKAFMIRLVKTFEIAVMLVGALGFYLHSVALLYFCTFCMGLHSTVFGPVKYAYLPQHLSRAELVGGNGMVEMGTFVAILIGTIVGGAAAALGGHGAALLGGSCIALALLGRLVSAKVPVSPAAQPDLVINWNPFSETWRNLKLAHADRTVFLALMGISWLWFVGATYLTSFFNFAKFVLSGNADVVTVLLATFSLGIGLGSLMCERMSGRGIEIGLVPFGSIGMSVFGIDLYFASRGAPLLSHLSGVSEFLLQPSHWRVLADLFLLAMFGGFYSVPLYALIQTRSQPSHRARIIAANNILNALLMILSALMALALTAIGFTIPQLFLTTALLNVLVAIFIYAQVPEFLLRFVMWLLLHTVYRMTTRDLEYIPEQGPCVLVCNHVSFVDAVVIGALVPRPVRFVMDHRIYNVPVLSWFFRTVKAIPIASEHENPAVLERAFQLIAAALEQGDVICLFPEGRLTADGEIGQFKSGVQRIIRQTPAPVVPMALRGLWGSFFSRRGGAAMSRPFRRGMLNRLELVASAPHDPVTLSAEQLQRAVAELRGAWR
jgi:1-acyl-sn-glycerol-3-phosphate acyltransferase